MDLIEWLQKWYTLQCDKEWEHMFGIKIYTVDNPGWTVKIDISDTEIEEKLFNEIDYEKGEDDWMFCFIKNNIFEGHGSSGKLQEILTVFKDWVES